MRTSTRLPRKIAGHSRRQCRLSMVTLTPLASAYSYSARGAKFDPRRERWYRDAERGYDRDYRMSRNEYRDVYRRGFMDGYETGYR